MTMTFLSRISRRRTEMWHPRGDICCFHVVVFFFSRSVIYRMSLMTLVFWTTHTVTLSVSYDWDDHGMHMRIYVAFFSLRGTMIF